MWYKFVAITASLLLTVDCAVHQHYILAVVWLIILSDVSASVLIDRARESRQ